MGLNCNKETLKCKKSAKATMKEDGSYLLYSWDGQHSSECRPNTAIGDVKDVKYAIQRCSEAYVRNTLYELQVSTSSFNLVFQFQE